MNRLRFAVWLLMIGALAGCAHNLPYGKAGLTVSFAENYTKLKEGDAIDIERPIYTNKQYYLDPAPKDAKDYKHLHLQHSLGKTFRCFASIDKFSEYAGMLNEDKLIIAMITNRNKYDFLIGTSYLHRNQLHMEILVPVVIDPQCTEEKQESSVSPSQFMLVVTSFGVSQESVGRSMTHHGIVHGTMQ